MKKATDELCEACGKPEKSCAYCRAEQDNRERRGFLGIPIVSWLTLALGGIIAAILFST